MTYDGTDPDDDGVVESDVDNQSTTTVSLDTEETNIIADDSGTQTTGSVNNSVDLYQETTGVSTSAKTIVELDANNDSAHLILVSGVKQGNSRAVFTDVILSGYRYGGAPSVLSSKSAAANARTYSKEGSLNTSVQLAMGGNTYDVTARSVGVRAP